jgi:hypothetical protein
MCLVTKLFFGAAARALRPTSKRSFLSQSRIPRRASLMSSGVRPEAPPRWLVSAWTSSQSPTRSASALKVTLNVSAPRGSGRLATVLRAGLASHAGADTRVLTKSREWKQSPGTAAVSPWSPPRA